jgi:[ribosomal protein S18]-alanine N-acetyltransferase
MTVRPMRWWDIPRVHHIETSCFSEDCWSVDQFWRELAGQARDYVVADSDGTVVGYAGISTIPPDSDLQTLAVDPEHRGSGVGRGLLAAMLQRAHERGATSMILEVRADNTAAQELYTDAGFETIATRRRYYPDGSDALIMRCRPLSAADGVPA